MGKMQVLNRIDATIAKLTQIKKGIRMNEMERMSQRIQIESMMNGLSLEERTEIETQISELKTILNTESINLETIAILIFLYRRTK